MSILSIFCPVKVFGYFVRTEHCSFVSIAVGSAVAVSSLSGSVFLYHHGFEEWFKPSIIMGLVGTATAILGLENKRICAKKAIKPRSENDETIKAIEYLATYYWKFWEQKIHSESEVLREHLVRPNIPLEFAFAFGNALLKALDLKINSKYEKICEREGNEHPEKWEFRAELRELEMREKDMWCKAKNILDTYRVGEKAFNRQKEDQNNDRPLFYCAIMDLLREFHPIYNKILQESRADKLDRLNKQMKSPALKLPIMPARFQVSTSTNTPREVQNREVVENLASNETSAASGSAPEETGASAAANAPERTYASVAANAPKETNAAANAPGESEEIAPERSAAEAFMGFSSGPVVLDRHDHLNLMDEPSARLPPL